MAAPFKVRFLRGSAAANAAHISPAGAITIDTDNWRPRLHDGVTAGGIEILNKADVDAAIAAAGGGGGAVDSVNGQTGVVVLTAADVGLDQVPNYAAATQAEMEAADDGTKLATALGVRQLIESMGFTQDGNGEWIADHGTIA